MPTYDYRCAANGQTIEVAHRMSDTIKTWGELCERAGIDLADTPAESPVERLISGGQFISTSSSKDSAPAPMGSCGGPACGCNF